ncbi:type II toxin-antitoxin system RelE/ParE family toxin [Patescibacteria group bacterium]|nr:type II toxin-antitoxin system RelE/ParE family toxin [Patescibacteria group bacterium]
MKIFPLHPEINNYLRKRNLIKKFEKQKKIFEINSFRSSLKTELLKPKKMRIWSFRVNRKYRAIFIFRKKNVIEIIDVNNHYQ